MLINDVLSSLEEAGDQVATGSVQIKSNFGYADYYPNFGWFGSIEYIAVEKGYKLRFNHDSFDENGSSNVYLNYSGVPASASSHPITVYSGWNWLGYIPQEPMLADDALASLQSTGGDYIKIKAANTDTMWIGSGAAGRVGIGTSNPPKRLHVKSDVADESAVTISLSDNTNDNSQGGLGVRAGGTVSLIAVSYTHLRAHET